MDKLPGDMSEGAQVGPADEALITAYTSGVVDRSPAVSRGPRRRMIFEAPSTGLYTEFHKYFITHRGGTYPFLVVDWSDYDFTSEAMTGTVDGNNKTFGLVKNYSTGTQSFARPIEYAESSAGNVLDTNGATILSYGAWSFTDGLLASLTVDTSDKDSITFTTAPPNGSGQPLATVPMYRVPMVFVNDWLPATLRGRTLGSVAQIELIEEFIR